MERGEVVSLEDKRGDWYMKKGRPRYERRRDAPSLGCFFCRGPHWTRECPKGPSAIWDQEEEMKAKEGHQATTVKATQGLEKDMDEANPKLEDDIQTEEKGHQVLNGDDEPRTNTGLKDVSIMELPVDLPPSRIVVDVPSPNAEPQVLNQQAYPTICCNEGIAKPSMGRCHVKLIEVRSLNITHDEEEVNQPSLDMDNMDNTEDYRNEDIMKSSGRECHNPIMTKVLMCIPTYSVWHRWARTRSATKGSYVKTNDLGVCHAPSKVMAKRASHNLYCAS